MKEGKLETIEKSVDEYKKLPEDKKMFVLGFMQGVLSIQQGEQREKEKKENFAKGFAQGVTKGITGRKEG